MGGAGFHIIFAHANILFFFLERTCMTQILKKKRIKRPRWQKSVNEFYKRLGKFMNERLKQM